MDETNAQTSSTLQLAIAWASGDVEQVLSGQRERHGGAERSLLLKGGVAGGTLDLLLLGFGLRLPVRLLVNLSLADLCKALSMGKGNKASVPYKLSLKLGWCFRDFLAGVGVDA